MADDPINIQVVDNVDASVANKLNAIADAADKGQSNIDKLRSSLAAIRGDNLSTLRDQANSVTDAINRDLAATRSLQQATDVATQSDASAARAKAALEAALARVTVSQNAAASSTARMDAATAAALLGEQKLETELARTAKARTDAALSALKLAEAETKAASATAAATEALTANAAAAEAAATANAAAAAKTTIIHDAGSVAQGAGNVIGSTSGSKAAYEAQNAAMGIGSAAKTAAAETQAATTASVGILSKWKTSALNAFDAVNDGVRTVGANGAAKISNLFGTASEVEKVGAAAAGAATHTRSWSTAIRETLVLTREASVGNFTRMAGSASILASALGLLNIALPVAAVGFATLYAAHKKWNDTATDGALESYANSLGLTEKEMRKLKDTTVDSEGHLKKHNDLMITYGDEIKGLIATIKENVNSDNVKSIASYLVKPTDLAMLGNFAVQVVGLLVGSYNAIVKIWQNFPDVIGHTFVAAFNFALDQVTQFINDAISGVNWFVSGANTLLEKVGSDHRIATLGEATAVHLKDTFNKNSKDIASTFADEVSSATSRAGAKLTALGKQWHDNTVQASKDRIKAEADAIKANRNPPREKKAREKADPKDKDDYLDDENKKLDDQIKTFGMLKEARDVQTQLNTIEEAFQKRRMPLNAAEIQQYRDKIELIQRNNRVQAQMDTIYTAINGPIQTLKDGQTALLQLYVRGNITLEQYNQQMDKLQKTYDEATDPLYEINKAMKEQLATFGLVGDAVSHQSNEQKVYNAYLAKGIDLTKNATAADRERAKQAVADLDKADHKSYINKQATDVLDPILADKKMLASKKEVYAALDAMRTGDAVKDKAIEDAKAAYSKKINSERTANMRATLDAIATLSTNHNKVLAAIGKAAAVAEATIDGIAAVQKALKSAPPPANFVLAGIVGVAAAANVAKIVSTSTDTGSYNNGGDFIVRGRTGVDQNRISMNVSDGERVTIRTQAQQQEAANNNNSSGTGDVHVHNYLDKSEYINAMNSEEGDRVIYNSLKRQPGAVAKILGSGR